MVPKTNILLRQQYSFIALSHKFILVLVFVWGIYLQLTSKVTLKIFVNQCTLHNMKFSFIGKTAFSQILRPDQTRPKKIAEGGVCTRELADDVPRSVIHSCSRKALLKCKTDPF